MVKLAGTELQRRLRVLAREAIEHHREAEAKAKGHLRHCREAGARMNEAKETLKGRKGAFGRWRVRHFIEPGIIDIRMCQIYMKIARKWNDAEFRQERRTKGGHMSLRRAIELTTKPKKEASLPEELTPEQIAELDWQDLLRSIVEEFRRRLKKEPIEHLKVLTEDPLLCDHLWGKFQNVLKKRRDRALRQREVEQ